MFEKVKGVCSVILASLTVGTALSACSQGTSSSVDSSTGTASNSVAIIDESGVLSTTVNPLGREAENGPINLKVWGPEAALELLKKQCDDFCDKMKEYGKINIEVVPQGEADPASLLLNDSTAAADVFGFASDTLDKLVNAGALLEVVGADKDFVVEENSEASVLAATIDDRLFAFPETGDNSYCLVYDKTVVSDEQAKTLEGVLKACEEKNKKFVMNAQDGYFSCIFMFTGGVTLDGFEDDGETQKFVPYNMKTATKTIFAFRDLLSKYRDTFINADVTKVVDGFKSGTVGAGIDGSWNFSYTKDVLGSNAGFAILPTIDVDGVPTQIVNVFGYKFIGVNSSTDYPNTSIELAKFLTGEDCQLQRAVELNWGPSNKKVAESTLIKSDAALSAILSQSEFSVPQVSISTKFWEPVAVFGNNVVDFDTELTEKDCQDLIRKTIANVRD